MVCSSCSYTTVCVDTFCPGWLGVSFVLYYVALIRSSGIVSSHEVVWAHVCMYLCVGLLVNLIVCMCVTDILKLKIVLGYCL